MSSIKSLQTSFLQFIQSYKQLFNQTMNENQQMNLSEQDSMNQKRFLADSLHQNYKNVISIIDSLEEVNFEDLQKANSVNDQKIHTSLQRSINEDDSFTYLSIAGQNQFNLSHQSSAHNLGNLIDGKYQRYEKQICQRHDQAVQRYRKAMQAADTWKQVLYTYINENLSTGN